MTTKEAANIKVGDFIAISNIPHDSDFRVGYVVELVKYHSRVNSVSRIGGYRIIFDYRRNDEDEIDEISDFYITDPEYCARFATNEEIKKWKKSLTERSAEWSKLLALYFKAMTTPYKAKAVNKEILYAGKTV